MGSGNGQGAANGVPRASHRLTSRIRAQTWKLRSKHLNPFTTLRRHLTPAQINFYFSIVCFFSPPVLGSLVSITFNAGGVWSVMLLATKRRRFNIDRPMLALTVAIYAYCAAMILASIVNGTLAVDRGKFMDTRSGHVLLRGR